MIKAFLSLLIGLSAVLVSVPASAQLSPGMSGRSTAPRDAGEDQYWFMIRQLGACLADMKTEQSVAFLESEIGSRNENRAFDALFNRSRNVCMRNFVSASVLRAHVRGAVAEGLYKRNVDGWNADMTVPVTPPESIGSIHDFARCYISANFTVSRGLLDDTKLATDSEQEYVDQMASGFQPCLPAGRDVRLKTINVRMALAEALYHATKSVPKQDAQ